jgi:serine/threonine protein kinase
VQRGSPARKPVILRRPGDTASQLEGTALAEVRKPAASVLPQLEPGTVFAGYRIECLLDRGGMGVVYKAVDVDLDRQVALKIIAPEHTQNETAVARFKSECRLAASLEHPNIVPIHRGGEFEGVLYLAMRFVPGTNLRSVIDRGPMDLTRVARIIWQVGAALDVAHERGLVHRDVKPANILLTGPATDPQVYLTDFGLTKRLGSDGGALTRTGGWVGTPDYVAPEQIQGRNVDRRADVYSLGCVLFEMLTGRVAYAKDSDMAKLWAHVTDPPPLPRTVRPDLIESFDDIVAKATAKDPADRYGTAGELAAAVRGAVTEQETERQRADAAPIGGLDAQLSATRDETFARHDQAPPPPPRATPPPPPATPPPPAATPPPPRGVGAAVPAAPPGEPPRPPGRRRGRSSDGGGWLRRHALPVGGLLLLAAVAVAAVALLSGGSSSTPSKPAVVGQRIAGKLGPVPTNRVSGNGNAVTRLNGRSLHVSITTAGLLDGAPHALHIHAGRKGVCPPASAAQPHNGHLSIATHAGVPYYGPAVAALTTRGDTSLNSLVAFNRYPNSSNVRYDRTITITPIIASYLRKNNAVVVVHGIDYNHNGVYDGVLERSDLDRSLTGESTAPALCGPLVAEKQAATGAKNRAQLRPGSSGARVFAAALTAAPGTPGALICNLGTGTDAEFRPA